MKNFMSQINMFEARLSKSGVGPKSNDWNGNFAYKTKILTEMIQMK